MKLQDCTYGKLVCELGDNGKAVRVGMVVGMQTITWQQFYKSYRSIYESVPSYRLGQHFCNLFIRDSNPVTCDPVVKGLWDKTGDEAFTQCFEVIQTYNWDVNALPLERKDLL